MNQQQHNFNSNLNPGIEIQNQVEKNPNQTPLQKKKNRTLQFYKFLLNSIKVEVILNEFFKLLDISSRSEIALWILSIILYFGGHMLYPLVWLHLFHILRGILGLVICYKLPKSYELIDHIDLEDKNFENKIYNDIVRDAVKKNIYPRLKSMKGLLLSYFAFTFINFMVDIVDFLFILSKFNENNGNDSSETFIFFVIATVYLVIDFGYIFWTSSLRLTFSPDLLIPINEAFSGVFKKLKRRMKLGKNTEKPAEGNIEINVIENPVPNANANNNFQQNEVELREKQGPFYQKNEYDAVDYNIQQHKN